MRRWLPVIFLFSVPRVGAGEPSFKLGDIELPGDCAALKPAPSLSPEDAARNGYRHVEAIARLLTYPEKKNTGDLDPNRFYDLHLMIKGGTPSGIMIGKAKLLLKRHSQAVAEWDSWLAAPACREPAVPLRFAEVAETHDWVPPFRPLRESFFANLWRIRIAVYEGRKIDAFADWLRCREGLARRAKNSESLVSQMILSVFQRRLSEVAWELSPSAASARSMPAYEEDFDAERWRRIMLTESRLFVVAAPRTDDEIQLTLKTPNILVPEEKRPRSVEEYKARVLPVFGTPAQRARECLDEIVRLGAIGMEKPRVFGYLLSVVSPYAKRWHALDEVGAVTPDVSVMGLAYLVDWKFRLFRRTDRVIVALRAYAAVHEGAYPESLDALVPDYLPSVPKDPFSEKPLRYDPVWPAVWSVGPDFKDDNGVGTGMAIRFGAKEPDDIVTRPFGAPGVRPVPPAPKSAKPESWTDGAVPSAP